MKTRFDTAEEVILFPLTSAAEPARDLFCKLDGKVGAVHIEESSRIIYESSARIKGDYVQHIADLPRKVNIGSKNLKQYFKIDGYSSLWWQSLIAEKNTFKPDSFTRLVQYDAILNTVKEQGIDRLILACSSEKLKAAFKRRKLTFLPQILILRVRSDPGLKKRFIGQQRFFYIKHLIRLFAFVIRSLVRYLNMRIVLGRQEFSDLHDSETTLFSYFPNFDPESARNGRFQNKYFGALQDSIEREGQSHCWILLYAENETISFADSLRRVRRFRENGYPIRFLEEYSSVGMILYSFLRMIVFGLKFLIVRKRIARTNEFAGLDLFPFFQDDWYFSFTGIRGFSGLLYYFSFRSLCKRMRSKKCLYFCEMLGWEKALNSAIVTSVNPMVQLAYQHGTIPSFMLSYFNHPSEIEGEDEYPMPRPDRIICNGQSSHRHFLQCGWPEDMLNVAEAIRYPHLRRKRIAPGENKKPVVLVVSSIGMEESSALLNKTYESLKEKDGIEAWFKPHPFLRITQFPPQTREIIENSFFQTRSESVTELLPEVRVTIVGASGVGIEALAYGSDVVIVNTPDWINMSPLLGVSSPLIHCVDTVDELCDIIKYILAQDFNEEQHRIEAQRILDDMFFFTEDSENPTKLLSFLEDLP